MFLIWLRLPNQRRDRSQSTALPISGIILQAFGGRLRQHALSVCRLFGIIYIISLYFERFLKLTYVQYAFDGIQACVVYLILSAAIQMLKEVPKTFMNRAIFGTVFLAMILFSLFAIHFSAVFYILICGMTGVAAHGMKIIFREKHKK